VSCSFCCEVEVEILVTKGVSGGRSDVNGLVYVIGISCWDCIEDVCVMVVLCVVWWGVVWVVALGCWSVVEFVHMLGVGCIEVS
jgi:hypothetical protein